MLEENPYSRPNNATTDPVLDDDKTSRADARRLTFNARLTYADQRRFENRSLSIVINLAVACAFGWMLWGSANRGELFGPRGGVLQLIASLGLGCLALQFWAKTVKKRRDKNASAACEGIYQACDYTVTHEEFTIKTKDTEISFLWSAFDSFRFAPEFLIVKTRNSASSYLFLKRWFPDESDWITLQAMIVKGVTENEPSS